MMMAMAGMKIDFKDAERLIEAAELVAESVQEECALAAVSFGQRFPHCAQVAKSIATGIREIDLKAKNLPDVD